MSLFQRVRTQCNLKIFYTTGSQKKIVHIVMMIFVDTATVCLEPCEANEFNAHVQKLVILSLSKYFVEVLERES